VIVAVWIFDPNRAGLHMTDVLILNAREKCFEIV
jgi:hypothetical protein